MRYRVKLLSTATSQRKELFDLRIFGVVEDGVPKVKICLDERGSKCFSFSSLAVFLKIGIHDPLESLIANK